MSKVTHATSGRGITWRRALGLTAPVALATIACSSSNDDGDANTATPPLYPAAGGTSAAPPPPPTTFGQGGSTYVPPPMPTSTAPPPASGAGGAIPTGAGGAPTSPPPTTAASFCSVQSIVSSKCHDCHGTERAFGAPMTLASYSDFTAAAVSDSSKKVYEMIGLKIHDTRMPMPPASYPPLTETEMSALDGWIAAGAPDESGCVGEPEPPVEPPVGTPEEPTSEWNWPADCEEFYELTAGSNGAKHTVRAGGEEHPQFFFSPPWPGDAQALAFRPITDNKKVLHHWILYSGDGAFLTGWAPGSTGSRPLPDDVGMYVPSAGGQLRLDMHYNNLGGATTEQDASGVEICTINTPSKFRPNTATVQGLTASASVPPNARVDNKADCNVTASRGPVHILSVSPHMHRLGVNAYLSLTHNGTETVLHDGPFAFDDQRIYPFDPAVVVETGDTLTTICSYENDTGRAVNFGQNTDDEMCFNFVLYYPMGGLSCGRGGFFGF